MAYLTIIKKAFSAFSKQPIPFFFFILDKFYDSIILNFASRIWCIEGKLRGGIIGKSMFLGKPMLKFFPTSKVVIKDGSFFISSQRRCNSGTLYGPCRIQTHSQKSSIFIDEGVSLNGTSIVSRSASISIGKETMIAPNCIITDSPFHRLWPPDQRLNYADSDLDQDVKIGSRCWIALGCVILPGSIIGDNSVIGARSVVSGEIPPNSLAIGSPAKVIRMLDENAGESSN